VLINREDPAAAGTIIWPGYETGARLAAEHLLATGCRRLIFLGLSRESYVDSVKLRGFRAALEHADVPFAEDRILLSAQTSGRGFHDLINGGSDVMARVLASGLEVDGIFATNDLPAIGALRYALRHGVRVPHDIALVGFGSSNVSEFISPSLSTISMPLYEIGVTAFHALLDCINNRDDNGVRAPRVVETAPELIVRESSAV
jgi:DNA-binding LacI/PurR family transcriptional regulator